jgi:Protein of unknown function (DUF1638)
MELNDQTLTDAGLSETGQGKVLIIACGALAREILALIEINDWSHFSLTCLPAILHNAPDKITPAVEAAVLEGRKTHERIFVAYADCGTGGLLQAACARLGVEMIEGPHCYSFFEGNQSFAVRSESDFRAFYLTDFLARQFDAFVTRPLGLDRHPELRDAYFGHYEKLIYLAQTDDDDLTEKAKQAAAFLNLSFERMFTGYGDLAEALKKV